MKKILDFIKQILTIILIFNCNNNNNYLYDIDPPKVIFYSFIDDKFLIQFNEPIEYLNAILNNKKFFLKNIFPKANIFISNNIFEKYEKNNLIIKIKDTSDNIAEIELLDIFNNPDPAILSIKEIRLRYTKKLNQMINFKVEKEGNLAGLKLILFFNGKKNVFTFEQKQVKKNDNLILNFLYNKNIENEKTINFKNSNNASLSINKHISQNHSLIVLLDHNNNINDYILYYNSQKNSLDKLKNSKIFKVYLDLLSKYNVITPLYFNINGNTSKKTIIKFNNAYLIKK